MKRKKTKASGLQIGLFLPDPTAATLKAWTEASGLSLARCLRLALNLAEITRAQDQEGITRGCIEWNALEAAEAKRKDAERFAREAKAERNMALKESRL